MLNLPQHFLQHKAMSSDMVLCWLIKSNCISTVYLPIIATKHNIIVALITFQSCKIPLCYYEPLCSILACDKPSELVYSK